MRRIDWAASARSCEVQTRVILEDISLTLGAMLDDTPSMRVGRKRSLAAAAREAVELWYAIAAADDRCVRLIGNALHPVNAYRGASSAAAALNATGTFDLRSSLQLARTALRPGAALVLASDCFDLKDEDDMTLFALARRHDCTLLLARDPWYDELPLSGVVKLRGAEGGVLRAYVGAPERERYWKAVRSRESALLRRFTAAGWRTGLLHESDGAASLAGAFGA